MEETISYYLVHLFDKSLDHKVQVSVRAFSNEDAVIESFLKLRDEMAIPYEELRAYSVEKYL